MDLGIISMRYAKALLRYAEENKQEEQVYAEMQTLSRTFHLCPALQNALLNPVMSSDEKVRLLTLASCGKSEPSSTLVRFLRMVVKNERADVMLFMAHSYCTLYQDAKHLVKARLVVATEVDDTVIARIRQIVEGKLHGDIQFEVEVQPEIEGGFILEYGTYQLDASLRSQMAKLKRRLTR